MSFRFNEHGHIVDFSSGDEGDSLNREGQFACLKGYWNKRPEHLVNSNWKPVRSNFKEPWNNPKNVTRDQLTPFICGIHLVSVTMGSHHYLKERLRPLGDSWLAPNTERDAAGTTKYPWPHSFINDKGVYEKRMFDHADLL